MSHNVVVHVLASKSRFSTPEIWAHDYVPMGRSVGTSATKKNIHVAPSEYVHFTAFFRPRWGAFLKLALYRFLALLELQKGWKQAEMAPVSLRRPKTREKFSLERYFARKCLIESSRISSEASAGAGEPAPGRSDPTQREPKCRAAQTARGQSGGRPVG